MGVYGQLNAPRSCCCFLGSLVLYDWTLEVKVHFEKVGLTNFYQPSYQVMFILRVDHSCRFCPTQLPGPLTEVLICLRYLQFHGLRAEIETGRIETRLHPKRETGQDGNSWKGL